MTDLEDAWDDIPSGEPPVGAILAEGRTRRRQQRRRPLMVVGGVAAMAAAFATGIVVSQPGGTDPTAAGIERVAFQADLDPADNCADLLAEYQRRGLDLVTAWGWGSPVVGYDTTMPELTTAQSRITAQGSSRTGTNVQEAGIDEPDTVKTDGKHVVRVRGSHLQVFDVTAAEPELTGSVRLPQISGGELLMSGDSVIVIGGDTNRDTDYAAPAGTRVLTVSIKDPSRPEIVDTAVYTSRIIAARQHGSAIRLVLADGPPALDFVTPDDDVTDEEALQHNRAVVESTTIDDWLPYDDSGSGNRPLLKGGRPLVACDQVAVPADSPGLDTVSIVGFTADEATQRSAIALVGSASLTYMSADRLYLADHPSGECFGCRWLDDRTVTQRSHGTTHLYEFELDGIYAAHVASGNVKGMLADRWSMDEADGVLRVAVGPSSATGNFNSLVTLRRHGQKLQEIGRIDKIGVNEDIKAVRWFDDLAVIVTFRRTDPLYTIDLSQPDRPTLRGELKIPGFSDYLHPVGDDLLLGVGYGDASATRVTVGLYDASDLADVKQTAVVELGHGHALAPDDPRAFTWLPKARTALTVIQKGDDVVLAAITVGETGLKQRLTHVEYGDDAYQVRTVALPDGRIVLVTGEDVRFFDVR